MARSATTCAVRWDAARARQLFDRLRARQAQLLRQADSVLGRTLWVFRRIVGQMQHDLFHVYTVDQHILMVVRNVRRFFIPEHAHEYPFCSQLAAQFDRPVARALTPSPALTSISKIPFEGRP